MAVDIRKGQGNVTLTREEFDVQSTVLRRTRERLALLEKRLAAVEDAPPAAPRGG